MVLSIETEKVIDKNSTLFMIKTLSKPGRKEILQCDKDYVWKTYGYHT